MKQITVKTKMKRSISEIITNMYMKKMIEHTFQKFNSARKKVFQTSVVQNHQSETVILFLHQSNEKSKANTTEKPKIKLSYAFHA